MTTAFLLTIGKKKKPILLLQDNLLFRFKNFTPSGQLVKLSSSQIAFQGCVPSLSLLPRGADYRPPHDGVRTWSSLASLGCLIPLFCELAWFCWCDWWKSVAPIPASPQQWDWPSLFCALFVLTLGCPRPALTAPPQLSKDCWDFSYATYKLWEIEGRDISSGLFLPKCAPGQGPLHCGFFPEFQVRVQGTHALSLQILLEQGTSSLLQTSATSILQPRKAFPPAGSLSVQYTPPPLRPSSSESTNHFLLTKPASLKRRPGLTLVAETGFKVLFWKSEAKQCLLCLRPYSVLPLK